LRGLNRSFIALANAALPRVLYFPSLSRRHALIDITSLSVSRLLIEYGQPKQMLFAPVSGDAVVALQEIKTEGERSTVAALSGEITHELENGQ